jgi:hypothetical protein
MEERAGFGTTAISEPFAESAASQQEDPKNIFEHGVDRNRHPVFRAIWFAGNVLLILAIVLVVYSTGWEYSTRRYLKGFSDAVVPASARSEDKVQAILRWMRGGPARIQDDPVSFSEARDPVETLNYAALLRVCGSATNAFVNLADSAGLTAGRLLLLDSRSRTKHVVAQVLIGGRWVVVDPAYRVMLHDAEGNLLTRDQLLNPGVFSAATTGIPGYDPTYTFERTTHVRLARFGIAGKLLGRILSRVAPAWEDSPMVTLLVERESLAVLAASVLFLIVVILARISLRWYSRRLGIHPPRVRQQLAQALGILFNSSSS